MNWLSKLFAPPDKRRARRHKSPPVLAFYWDGELPTPHAVPDISRTGMFLKTDDRWTSRSMLRVTLQMQSDDPEKSAELVTVQCQVVRTGEDGVGLEMILAENSKPTSSSGVGSLTTRKQFRKFLDQLISQTNEKPSNEPGHILFSQAEQSRATTTSDHQHTEQDHPENT